MKKPGTIPGRSNTRGLPGLVNAPKTAGPGPSAPKDRRDLKDRRDPRDPTKKTSKPVIIISASTEKKKPRNMFGASDEKIHKKPHATREGSWASIKRASKRFKDKTYKIEDYGDKSLHTQWKAEHKARHKKMKNKAKGGRAGFQHGGRTNLLEELGRVEGEHSNRNRRAEVSRIHGELNKGYKSGGAVLKGKKVGIQIK